MYFSGGKIVLGGYPEDTGRSARSRIWHRAKRKVGSVAGNPLRSPTAKREDAKIFALPQAP